MRLNVANGLCLSLCLSALTALAETKPKRTAPKRAADAETDDFYEPTVENRRMSSTEIRGTKAGGAELQLTPLSDFILKYGVSGYYQMNSDLRIGGTFLTGSEDAKSKVGDLGTVKTQKADFNGLAVYGYARYFVGNSFTVLGGLGLRQATIDYRIEDTASTQYIEGNLKIASIVLPLSIGNHWSFGNGLTLGCDWLMVMVPISGSSSSSMTGNVTGNLQTLNDDFKALGDGLAKRSSVTLLLTGFGYSF